MFPSTSGAVRRVIGGSWIGSTATLVTSLATREAFRGLDQPLGRAARRPFAVSTGRARTSPRPRDEPIRLIDELASLELNRVAGDVSGATATPATFSP